MSEGYEVAADDLKAFGQALEDESVDYGKQKTKAEQSHVDFTFPVIGLIWKSAFNQVEDTAIKALGAFETNLKQSGTSFKSIAKAYRARERANADTAQRPNEGN